MAAMLAAAVVTAGVTSLAVLMVMVVTVNIGIIAQISAEQCVHCCVSVSADTAVELDARFGQRCLRSAADAAADQRIHAVLHQKTRQGTMAAAVGINDFRMNDLAIRSFIKLKLLGVAEMLENLTVFISNCNFHDGISFAFFVGFFCVGSLHPAATTAVSCLLSSADTVVSPGDVQRFPVDKARCDLAPCTFVNLLHGRAGNVHLRGTLFVGLLLQVNQPNDLVLVQRQQDRLDILAPVGAESIDLRCATNPTAPWRSWHGHALLRFRYIPIIRHILRIVNKVLSRSLDTTALESELSDLEAEINIAAELIEECIKENAHVDLDQAEYQKRYDGLVARFDKAKVRHTEVTDLIAERTARRHQIETYLKDLRGRELLTEFRETDWLAMVDYITVHSKNDIRVTFKDGTEIKA